MRNKRGAVMGALRPWAVALLVAVLSTALAPTAQAGPNGTQRPMTGSCETDVAQLSNPGDIPIVLAVKVYCHLTHLGLTTGGTQQELVIPPGPPTSEGLLPIQIAIARITYIAANGDQLWSTFTGPGTIELATGKAVFNGTETFVGGTGRFTGATGSSDTAGQGSLVDNRGFLTISGTISY